MNNERENAYYQLINALLTCDVGKEQEILNAHPDLLDAGLVKTMLQVADEMIVQSDLKTSNQLMNLAGQMLGVYANTSIQQIGGNLSSWKQLKADRLMQQGVQQLEMGQPQETLRSSQQALTIFHEIGNIKREGDALGLIGNAYHSLSEYDKAIEYNQRHLGIARQTQDRTQEGLALGNLGFAYYSLGEYNEAIEHQQQSLLIARKVKNRYGESTALLNLGLAYAAINKSNEAI
ncbi:MAG: tetratricopeptide repeat protein [Rhizonema sp. PD38]|nr:tetratricopeptide repeat protein [Rhizonema sp. PD38]